MEDKVLTSQEAIQSLIDKTNAIVLPTGLQDKLAEIYSQLKISSKSEATFWDYFDKANKYINWIISLPWNSQTQDILDISYTNEKLKEGHHGLDSVKERILEYVSVLALQKTRNPDKTMRAPVLLFSGLVGTGKTTMAKSIADVLGRQFIRIPFGGLGDTNYLRGRSRNIADSEPGAIIKSLTQIKSKNPVILLDEIDRVSDEALNSIMGVLVELLDPEQNSHFVDHYIDYPFDLSQVLFCATCNNTNRIATAVLDRLEVIQMPSYSDDEKTTIGRDYLFPKALLESGLNASELQISPDVWPQIVRPLGFDAGVRTLQRNIQTVCRKAAYMIFSGQSRQIVIDQSNIKQFIPQ